MYKYFTMTDGGFFKDHQLISRDQVSTLLAHKLPTSEYFATIQDYDAEGNIIGCPLYFDIDSSSLFDAWEDMRDLDGDLRYKYGRINPKVYFSGSKGFHIIAPLYIRHERCHEIVAMIAEEITNVKVDTSVYRTRSMWRCNNTWNDKGQRTKKQIRSDLNLETILSSARFESSCTHLEDLDITHYVDRLPERNESAVMQDGDFQEGFYPCMKKLWEMESPDEGQRHQFIHIMARHCLRSGLSKPEAHAVFEGHHLYATFRNREYERVVNSVYRSGKATIGCKSGADARVLQPHCHGMCPWRDEWRITDVFKTKTDLEITNK